MARKRKNVLPSGNYRVRVYVGKVDGKKKYKAFTGSSKAMAESKANEWKFFHKEDESQGMTVYECCARYIELKEDVLSPSTIKSHDSKLRTWLKDTEFGNTSIYEVTNASFQRFISSASMKVKPKTARNLHSFVSASLKMFMPEKSFYVSLPQAIKPELYTPSSDDVKALIDLVSGYRDRTLYRAILLGAFCTMREGEICAVEGKDIKDGVITVNKAYVQDRNGSWVLKHSPKTDSSNRSIELPRTVVDELKGIDGRIVPLTPMNLASRFRRAIRASGVHPFRFHDLRHYSASILHAIGIPDQYIMQRGGWSTDNVMKRVYRNTIDEETKKQTRKINDYFDGLV